MDTQEEEDRMSDGDISSIEEDNTSSNSDHDFTTKTWREDFCFIVEDKRLYVAKVILALASPVFERMFQSQFKEKDEAEMTLPGKKFEDMLEFLRCIYPSVMKAVTMKNARQIVALAEEYQVVTLKSRCEECLLSSISSKTSAKDLYGLIDLACLYSLDDLFHKCTTLAAEKSLADLDEAERQTSIAPAAKIVIQRKIIDKMGARQVQTSQLVDSLNAELQRVATLNNYHRAELLKEAQLNLDDFKGWSGTSIFRIIDSNEQTQSYTTELCGIEITIKFEIFYRSLQFTLDAPKIQDSALQIVGKVVVVNGITGKKNVSRIFKYSNNFNMSKIVIMEEHVLRNGEHGFTYHGKTEVEVHLFAKINHEK